MTFQKLVQVLIFVTYSYYLEQDVYVFKDLNEEIILGHPRRF